MPHKPNVHIIETGLDDLDSVPDAVKDIVPYIKIGHDIGKKTARELMAVTDNNTRYFYNASMQAISELLIQAHANVMANGEDRQTVRLNVFRQLSDALDAAEQSVNNKEQNNERI